ncbi:hypothetical protein GPA10_09375 [Streptomyces sp. p1417]|uniref:Uncharacterized protein n=1 Tax=Streptomyces typhae TaxID=2681492 RepID=A0A6L6WTF8_9ACTN|nr:hypothetical protein [Streptomyces typhae]MVO84967.1 hypothetical protein [Streptomyces typhae]
MFSTQAARRRYEACTAHLRRCSQCHHDTRCTIGAALVRAYLRQTRRSRDPQRV